MTDDVTYHALNQLAVWSRFSTITLDEMRGVKLMNRVDTKYVLSVSKMFMLLERAADEGYRVQILDDVRAARYDTLYYDTDEREMYLMHHNQHLTRQKVRTRRYVDGGGLFLEIKNKNNRGRTRKRRVEICDDNFGRDLAAIAFLREHSRYSYEDLSPALTTRFTRITLVNRSLTERLTIDLDLHYCDVRGGATATIDNMVIVELKQDGLAASQMKEIMRELRVAPLKVSKYCIGTALTVDGIKSNRFKERLREVEKCLSRYSISVK